MGQAPGRGVGPAYTACSKSLGCFVAGYPPGGGRPVSGSPLPGAHCRSCWQLIILAIVPAAVPLAVLRWRADEV